MYSTDKLLVFGKDRPFTLRDACDQMGVSYRQLQRAVVCLVRQGKLQECGVGQRGQKLYVVVGST